MNMNRKFFTLISVIAMGLVLSINAKANDKTDTVTVAGVCESCKGQIEKAAKQAGATTADWNEKSKLLSVSYNDSTTSVLAIEKKIAAVGYDTRDIKAADQSYNKLPSCCKYDRSGANSAEKVCDDKKQ